MLVNRTNLFTTKPIFKGYKHEYDNAGNSIFKFNYPFDSNSQKGVIEIYPVKENKNKHIGYNNDKNDYTLLTQKPYTYELKEGGTYIDVNKIPESMNTDKFIYRISINNKPVADTGLKVNDNGYTLFTTKGTAPMIQGAACLTMPDSHRPGAYYASYTDANTGSVLYSIKKQKEAECTIKNTANKLGGSLAGIEYDIPKLKDMGFKTLFSTPIAGGDNVNYSAYWTKNNMQMAKNIGNIDNFKTFSEKLFKNGMTTAFDGTFTSEGLEGIHLQYALRWADKKPQSYYWFKLCGLQDEPMQIGVIPKNKENMRFRVINSTVVYDEKTNSIKPNKDYNPKKETIFQIYDATQVTEEQLADVNKLIDGYTKSQSQNELATNSYNDIIMPYAFEINPKEYESNLKDFVKRNKGKDNKVTLNSADGALIVGNFTNFRIGRETQGAVTWDGNNDMIKLNYHLSGFDDKMDSSIASSAQREIEKTLKERGAYEVQDLVLQSAKYWTHKVNEIQTLYSVKALKNVKNVEDINELIQKGELPKEVNVSQGEFNNIINGWYDLKPKGVLTKQEATLQALMSLPLDSLEFGENTVGVLATSYFSNRAINDETLGKTRFELMNLENPQLIEPYKKNYEKVNNLFKNQLNDFANKIVEKLNSELSEKLLTSDNNYTEYGEYVIEQFGQAIAKYALLKALYGDNMPVKMLENGDITYDYETIKNNTTLKSLGIKANTPQEEAEKLANLIEKGLNKLSDKDVEFLASAFAKNLQGTNTQSFRLAEALVKKSGLGLSWRLDAMKDVGDMDAIRSGEMSFGDAMSNVTKVWGNFVKAVKSENPNSNIVAEITDIYQLMQDNYGKNADMNDKNFRFDKNFKNYQDALNKLITETGVTTEAAYSYFFTDLLKMFSPEFEYGNALEKIADRNSNLRAKLEELINTRDADYLRNLYSFADNHDKPSVLHGLALDMQLFNSNLDTEKQRSFAAYVLNPEITSLNNVSADEVKKLVDDKDKFRKISPRAVAMSLVMKTSINDNLKNIATQDQIAYLNKAIADLTNGNYLDFNAPENKAFNDFNTAMRQNGYASRDFETVIKMIIKQAEFLAIKDKKLPEGGHFENSDKILETVFRNTTEPAVQKAVMYMQYLAALPGIPTVFLRDMLGALGYEEKAKNVYVQNRNAIVWSQLEEGPLKDYRTKILKMFQESFLPKEVAALKDGTPYLLGSSSDTCPAYLMQNAENDMAITIFNANGININNQFDYFKEYGLDDENKRKEFFEQNHIQSINPDNKYVPIQKSLEIAPIMLGGAAIAVGTVFENINSDDKTKYVIKLNQNNQRVLASVSESGKLILDGLTAKNGVMVLRKVAQKITFKGFGYYNQFITQQ